MFFGTIIRRWGTFNKLLCFSTEFMFIARILHYQTHRMLYCNGVFSTNRQSTCIDIVLYDVISKYWQSEVVVRSSTLHFSCDFSIKRCVSVELKCLIMMRFGLQLLGFVSVQGSFCCSVKPGSNVECWNLCRSLLWIKPRAFIFHFVWEIV